MRSLADSIVTREVKPITLGWAIHQMDNGKLNYHLCEAARLDEVMEVSRHEPVVGFIPTYETESFRLSDIVSEAR